MSAEATPDFFGFLMPAEWDLHEATWLAWPHNPETWIGCSLEQVESAYVDMIRALVPGENVRILVNDEAMEKHAALRLKDAGLDNENLFFHRIPTNDAWIRDYGPNFIARETETGGSEVAANLWKFDSWGGKYAFDQDCQAAGKILQETKIRKFEPGIVLEGGSIDVNGRGTCLTTQQCLLNPNRNKGKSWEEMEQWMKQYLGVTHVIWCQGTLEGDDTDGHIDNLARFVNSNTVLCVWDDDASDPNHACMKENLEILGSSKDQNGNPLQIIKLPTPGRIEHGTERLPASYANFYIGNSAVLLPVFGHPNDKGAEEILAHAFSDREVVTVPGKVLVSGLGGPHCLTQQQPVQFNL